MGGGGQGDQEEGFAHGSFCRLSQFRVVCWAEIGGTGRQTTCSDGPRVDACATGRDHMRWWKLLGPRQKVFLCPMIGQQYQ